MNWLRSIVLFLALTSLADAADWPQWLGPRRDGSTAESVSAWKEDPKVLWRCPAGSGFSVPVVANGRVFVYAAVKGENADELKALDAESGKELWRETYTRSKYNSVLGVGPKSTPTVALDRVFTYGVTGMLTCFDAATGKQLWQVDAYKRFDCKLPNYGVCCSPLVIGNRVIVSVGGKDSSIVAFDAKTGEVQWQGFEEPASTSSPVPFVQGAIPDAVFMTTLRLTGINPLDGKVRWEHALPFQPSGTAPTPIRAGNLVLTSTVGNGTTAVRVLDKDGQAVCERAWQNKDLTGYFSTGVSDGKKNLYLITNKVEPLPVAGLECVDLDSGKSLWKKSVGFFHAGLIRTANGLLMLDDSGNLKLIEANAKEYRELASAKVCGGTFVTPALANGRLYLRDDKEIICLQMTP